MPVRKSGEVVVDLVYDRRLRMRPMTGAYRARVLVRGETVDSLFIGAPAQFRGSYTSDDAYDEVAETAIRYSLGDAPDLPVERDEAGNVIVERVEEP